MAKWDNMLSILWMLQARGKMTAAEIAESLEISVRTVYRYVDGLCASGVPIMAEAGHEGGFQVLESFRETPIFFDSEELRAMAEAAKFADGAGYPYTAEMTRALAKIEHGLKPEQLEELQRRTSGLEVILPPHGPSLARVLRQLETAVTEGHTVNIAYRKEGDTLSEREIDPYGIAYRRQQWYVVARCHQAESLRTFRVDRITEMSETGQAFDKPAGFSVAGYFRDQSDSGRETEAPLIPLRIAGEPEDLSDLCGHWHLQHYLSERHDREVVFLLDEQTMHKYLPVYLLTFGTRLSILEPEQLRIQMAETARRLAAHHLKRPGL
ncbi:helix-turn-helix transcriptional regulator [Paenibacillus daejeonensis]|uniref:helix-turn-helix transcriptional regulator n=1 Tax=Paenibacillus daejeonensis TaxID=135193 RepID=UPI00037AC149|nr:YafY family protein [Paenibacillus daejeonensis]